MSKSNSVKLKVVKAPTRDALADCIRVHSSYRDFAKPGDIILVKVGGKQAFANVRPNLTKDEVKFDLAMREKLAIDVGQVLDFVFEEAGWCGPFRWAWNATDAMPRVAARLAAISVVLGGIGLLLGVVSLCL